MRRNNAVIILHNDQKKILLQHRDKNLERLPGYWAFFGGGIKEGETPEQALVRETIEELNYRLKNPRLIMVQEFKDEYHFGTKYVFMEKYDPSKKLTLREGQGMSWFTLDETSELKIIKHDREIIESIKDKY